MLTGIITSLDWISIVLGAVLAFALGAVWYSPLLFGKQWMQAQPHRKKSDYQMSAAPMLTQAAATFTLALLLNIIIATLGWIGASLFLLFLATESRASSYFLGQQQKLWMIDFGYRGIMVIIICLTRILLFQFA